MVSKIIAVVGATGNQSAKLAPSPALIEREGTNIPDGIPLNAVAMVAIILRRG